MDKTEKKPQKIKSKKDSDGLNIGEAEKNKSEKSHKKKQERLDLYGFTFTEAKKNDTK